MKKVLIGMICDGKAGGIDRYLLNIFESVREKYIQIDFLTNEKSLALEEELNKKGSNLFEVSALTNPVKQYNQVKTIIKKYNYDVVYINISTALSFPALKAAYDSGVKKIITHSHTSGYDCENSIKRAIFTFLHFICKGLVCRYSNSFFACSDKAAEWMFTKKIIKNNNFKIIYNAIDTEKFAFDDKKRKEIRCRLGIENNFVIGNVGNMCYQKNQLFLIEVFNKLLEKEPNARLVIIGDGVLLPKIKEKIASYNIQEKVKLLGRVDASEGYMNAFDVFALPSNFEGLGIVFIEAQCSKVPCIASNQVPRLAKISNMFSFLPFEIDAWVDKILSYIY